MFTLGYIEQLMLNEEEFADVYTRLLHNLEQSNNINFTMTTWSIQRKQNLKLQEDNNEFVDQVIERACNLLHA